MSQPVATDVATMGKPTELKLKPKSGKNFSLDLGDTGHAKDEDIK
jgi:hypothetical protein